MKPTTIRLTFAASALYDAGLGVGFLLAAPRLFDVLDIPQPNHYGYVHFPAWLLLVFAWMFVLIARQPKKYAHLIPFGVLLKVGYCGVATYHWVDAGIPWAWKPFIFIDAVFAVLFVLAYRSLRRCY